MSEIRIVDQFRECLKDVPLGTRMLRKEIVALLHDRYGTNPNSILPSDYCYNMMNKGIPADHPSFFINVSTGLYEYVGEQYMKQRFDEEYQQLNRQLNALLVQQAKLNKTLSSENKWLESMHSVIDGGELTRELVVALVEKVLVYEDADHTKRIEVILKYQEDFETLRSAWEELKGEGQE